MGFSFNDNHIVTAIVEDLGKNPCFQLMLVNKRIFNWSQSFIFQILELHIHNNVG